MLIKKFAHLLLASVFFFSCGTADESTPEPSQPGEAQPAVVGYQLIKAYPHDSTCFTEGLQYVDGKLLESAGQWGESDIRFSDLETGKVLLRNKLDKQYFGEGCTLLNGKVYQMTYQENTCFVYDAATLKKIGQFQYSFGEGWGMTTDGTHLIISNGGSNLYFYDPETFREVKRIGVTNQYGPVSKINELELIKGSIYANVWMNDQIFKIDTATGKVTAIINLEDLRAKAGIPPPDLMTEEGPDVLNGIAYDSVSDRVFITGKYWPRLFEVKFDR